MAESKGMKNPFSSGLGRTGKIGAWFVAFGVVAAWNYYNTQGNTGGAFTKDELEAWNKNKKVSKKAEEGKK
eukprot:CAMPEP_0113535210 /NCGR_PEP_ID=MMETSP0015_2-20120614/5577_1 /TAXON_ID=2838 /ORGANISM="Odontella" /LENGTH=70 /DNA_ID=CAMNT_0000434435 /DNA_START=342 /DNA_END=554 /DNA_ORIENTATION=+ /assembly_acc=CAM_ASM_000160